MPVILELVLCSGLSGILIGFGLGVVWCCCQGGEV